MRYNCFMIKNRVLSALEETLKSLTIKSETIPLSHPQNPEHGDFATGIAMKHAKEMKKSPLVLAQKIADAIPKDELIEKVEVVKPGFINIFLKTKVLNDELIQVLNNDGYGKLEINKGKTAIVEYSSPNIAKPFTIGHLRSTIIGDSIANILAATGYDVKRDNHIGDWGTQFGKLIYGVKEWGDISEIEKSEHPIRLLVQLYVKFHDESEKNPGLEDIAREYFMKLEQGDPEIRKLWNQCVTWSWKEFDAIYKKLGVTFTENKGKGYSESFFTDKLDEVIGDLENKKILVESRGAKIVEFGDDKFPPLMIIKQDGASLYATRDLATDKFRLEKYGQEVLIINEVGAEQSLYFRQLYELEAMLGWFQQHQRKHVGHGLYRFKDEKMSTRKGNTIWLEDVIQEAEKRAATLSKEFNNDLATSIAIASLKWNDLKRSSNLDIIFDWDEVLSMEGNSGPYLLYTYVRIQSVLKQVKGEITLNDVKNGGEEPEEKAVLRLLYQFPEVVELAAQSFAPHVIAQYSFTLAQSYNLLYQKLQILKAEPQDREFRLALSSAAGKIIKNGLQLLGITTVERM